MISRAEWRSTNRSAFRAFLLAIGSAELVYFGAFGDIRAAIAREKQIKGWLRARKIALIETFNPGWKDLSIGLP